MVRNYVRKSERAKKYSKQDLADAVEQVKSGQRKAYRASQVYHIPLNTLLDHVKGRRGEKSSSYGRPTALPIDVEAKLANHLGTMEKHGFGLSRREVMNLVGDYVKQNKLKTLFKDDIPSKDWLGSFMKRHRLSVKKPENVEQARRKSVDPFIINNYFDLVNKTFSDLKIQDQPHLIWNLDETSFCSDPTKTKVVGKKGAKSTRTTSTSGRENTSVLFACNANGDKAPPLIIFKGKQIWTHMMPPEGKGYPGTTYAATCNGWMQSDVFENYFQNSFLKTIGSERPVVLIYDGHATHVGLKVIQMAIEANVTIIKLPPHSSHILQPLDLSVMKSIKDKWDPALVTWQRKHIGQKLPKSEFSILLGQLWSEISREVISNGFKKAGLYPFNNKIIPEDSYNEEVLARWKAHNSLEINNKENIENSAGPSNAGNSVNSQEDITNNNDAQAGPLSATSFDQLLLACVKKGSAEKIKRTKICSGAEIITAEEVLEKMKRQEQEKKKVTFQTKKGGKNRKGKKKSLEELETSEEDIHMSDAESDIEDLLALVEREQQEKEDEELHEKSPEEGDWVLVRFCTKKTKRYFVGQIQTSSGVDPEVRFVRKVLQNNKMTTCKFPEIDDISEISQDDIIFVLPPPQVGRRGELNFPVSFTNYNIE